MNQFRSTQYERRLNSPNYIVVHPKHEGRVFFTDPPYGLMIRSEKKGDGEYLNARRALDFNGVHEIRDYRIQNEHREIRIVDKEIPRPNGIALSPDCTYLKHAQPYHCQIVQQT